MVTQAGAQLGVRAVARSPHPRARPSNLTRSVMLVSAPTKVQSTRVVARGASGSICGTRTIIGERLASIPGRLPGCGVSDPVRVASVDGVRLSQAAIMDCTTAKALNSWVKKGVKPAILRLGGGVASLSVIGHYSCRTRNNIPGEKISEHGKGHAIDISGVVLKNGTKLTVLKGWQDRTQGKLLRQMHKVACGPFGTVLGPGANKYHQDHFHLDTARQRGGSYCR